MYKITKENSHILVKNGNELHIVKLKQFSDEYVCTSFKKYPIKNLVGGFDMNSFTIHDSFEIDSFFFKDEMNDENQIFDFIQNTIDQTRMQYVLKTKRDHQVKFRTEVLVKIGKYLIHDCVAKVDKKFVYFDKWKCKRSNIYCIILPNGKRKFRFKFNKHEKCKYNVDNVPLISIPE